MRNSKFKPSYIRDWRKHRGLSLRALAARMESEPGIELISHAQLSRIETGQQPYSQPILEAAAHALSVTVVDLLHKNPSKDGEVIDLLRLLSDSDKEQAVKILKALAG